MNEKYHPVDCLEAWLRAEGVKQKEPSSKMATSLPENVEKQVSFIVIIDNEDEMVLAVREF